MVVAMLGADLGSDDLEETLVNVLTKMLFLYYLMMYDDWSVVGNDYTRLGWNMCKGKRIA
jgi:hypothetical protein